jgi:hypothetical protein
MPFLRRSWTVRVGTYFQDSASDRIREVDILAEKRVGERLIIRVVVSVKGFPLHQTPVVYSLPADTPHSLHRCSSRPMRPEVDSNF